MTITMNDLWRLLLVSSFSNVSFLQVGGADCAIAFATDSFKSKQVLSRTTESCKQFAEFLLGPSASPHGNETTNVHVQFLSSVDVESVKASLDHLVGSMVEELLEPKKNELVARPN